MNASDYSSVTHAVKAVSIIIAIAFALQGKGGMKTKADKVLSAGKFFIWGNIGFIAFFLVGFITLALTQNLSAYYMICSVAAFCLCFTAPAGIYSWAVLFRSKANKAIYYPFMNKWTIAAFILSNGIMAAVTQVAPMLYFVWIPVATVVMFMSNRKIKQIIGMAN
ncbi:hypothetical protein [Klebsiella quasipneumoniae]|uniref:hypothetical protein n=1 Tax=Klebsiella quasipneumoniae TaxID=1463165 RepID=UPI000A266F1F|nr:hypothetical protein [Klebsiella quasipneumoniae]MBC5182676.1 hypothetical protein [Klebsiella quasipneumoniae]MCW9408709.1 hypothetical protein [Klebsiella quasipneumoniae]SSD82170.1 Uncharacterised protein [Klebsiella quasipneumoniae]SXD22854.1 Uncharacterised protein [Klebsiella quasipneumoniae]HDG7890724.1 hypothetical protein [Klebsiella quasipneumoniae]